MCWLEIEEGGFKEFLEKEIECEILDGFRIWGIGSLLERIPICPFTSPRYFVE